MVHGSGGGVSLRRMEARTSATRNQRTACFWGIIGTMGTYAVTVDFDEDVDKLTLSEIYDALGAQARREMTLTGGKPTSVGLNPVTFYLVIDDPTQAGVDTAEVTGSRAAQAVMAQALLDVGYTAESAQIDVSSIELVG
jgi:hypothetical protein